MLFPICNKYILRFKKSFSMFSQIEHYISINYYSVYLLRVHVKHSMKNTQILKVEIDVLNINLIPKIHSKSYINLYKCWNILSFISY